MCPYDCDNTFHVVVFESKCKSHARQSLQSFVQSFDKQNIRHLWCSCYPHHNNSLYCSLQLHTYIPYIEEYVVRHLIMQDIVFNVKHIPHPHFDDVSCYYQIKNVPVVTFCVQDDRVCLQLNKKKLRC